jgi:hypothetical protein
MPDRGRILVAALAGTSLAACRPPVAEQVDAGAPAATAIADGQAPAPTDASTDAGDGDAGASAGSCDPRALLLARGALQGDLVPILLAPPVHARLAVGAAFTESPVRAPAPPPPSAPSGVPGWVGFLGDAEVTRAPWAVVGCQAWSFREAGLAWPVAAQAVGRYVDEARGVVYARVRSAGLLGQPAGLTGVVLLRMPGTYPAEEGNTDDWPLRLAGVSSDEELRARVLALRSDGSHGTSAEEQGRLHALFGAASASGAALSRAADPEGLDVDSAGQGRFRERLAHLRPAEAPRAPHLGRVLAAVREASTVCAWTVDHEPSRPAGMRGLCRGEHGSVVLRRRPDGVGIEAVVLDPPIAAREQAASPKATKGAERIAARPPSPGTLRAVRELWSSATVLAEAPWGGDGGTIAVAEVPPGASEHASGLLAVTVAGSYAQAQRIYLPDFRTGEARVDVAFADVDGDGFTDLVLHPDPAPEDAPWARVFLSPRDAQTAGARDLQPDEAVAALLPGATSFADAVTRILGAPRGAVSPAQARAALQGRRLSPGARAFDVDKSGVLTDRPLADLRPLVPACKDPGGWELSFSCDPRRPVCHAHCATVRDPVTGGGGMGEPGTYFTYVLTTGSGPTAILAVVHDYG